LKGETDVTKELGRPTMVTVRNDSVNGRSNIGRAILALFVAWAVVGSAGFAQGTWTIKAWRGQPQGGVIGGLLYAVGGSSATGDNRTLERYDPNADSWTTLAQMPITDAGNAGRYGGAAGVINNQLFVAGGWRVVPALPTSSLLAYDPPTNTWSTKATMPRLSACSAAGVIGGRLYVLTACDGFSGYRQFLDVYDSLSNTWTTRAPAPNIHVDGSGAVVAGKFYVAGGGDATGTPTSTLDVYDPVTNTWTTLSPMPTARSGAAVGVIGGRLYVAGGSDGLFTVDVVEIYDPVSDTWAFDSPMPFPLAYTAAGVIADKLYVAKGLPESNTVQILTPAR
jgi:N-acetylneuraminic acid mutarotase